MSPGVRRSPVRPQVGHARLGHRLELARRRAFVGRDEQIAAFREALSDADAAPLLFLHGAGGTGKTALLQRFADEAARAGRQVFRPGRFGAGVDDVEVVRTLVPLLHGRTDAVLLIDDLDDRRPLEPWLRERLLLSLYRRPLSRRSDHRYLTA